MKWFSSDSRQKPEALTEQTSEFDEEHRSLALNALWHRLQAGQSNHILDLGRASSDNLDFYARCSRKIYIEDLHSTLKGFDYLSPDKSTSLEEIFKYLMPYGRGTHFDAIFSWDLFNYLEPPQFAYLVRHLSRFCRPGAIIFAMISTRKLIPEQPGMYRIIDSETISYQSTSKILQQCPQYQETDLTKMLPGFRVVNSFLLRNGIKEFLLSYGQKSP